MSGKVQRSLQYITLMAIMLPTCLACRALHTASGEPQSLTPERSVAINSAVRAFMRSVAYDVTHDGPTAWRKYLADGPEFFMAVNGNWAFQDSAAATAGIQSFASSIRQIELDWGGDLRVDPLAPDLAMVAAPYHEVQVDTSGHRVEENGFFTGVAQLRDGHWKFRDAHWSMPIPSAPAH